MQPLYSVDHESRNNTNHAENERELPRSSENTPLLQRFPYNEHPRNPFTNIIVTLLLIILIAGVVIGIYLLILQNKSENVIPSYTLPLQLVSRSQWDSNYSSQNYPLPSPYGLRQVMVVQTNTEPCLSLETCKKLLMKMKANATTGPKILPYNFLISPNGQTYEALGWHQSSPILTPQPANGLILAFIGNFTQAPPTRSQLEQAKDFFAESVSQQYLHPSYSIIGRNVHDTPLHLLQSLKEFPQWSNEFFDSRTN